MNIVDILQKAVEESSSDIFIVPGSPVMYKVNGMMRPATEERALNDDTERLLMEIYEKAGNRSMDKLLDTGDDDFSFSLTGMGRFRCNTYKQRGSLAAVLRRVPFGLPNAEDLHIPPAVMSLSKLKRGMVLVTGPAGSGKSTTLNCVIDKINREVSGHIITIEDPIEYLHQHRASIVSQREIALDTTNHAKALRAALRQAPDVVLLGEMRDYETIHTALTAAETGHLLFSTLHTVGAAKTIDRIVDVFPANQQQQIRVQLSMVLQAVVSQQLIPTKAGGILPAFEIMIVNNAIQNMIREGKGHLLDNEIYAGASQGMMTMDGDLLRLYKEGIITKETALLYATNAAVLSRKLI